MKLPYNKPEGVSYFLGSKEAQEILKKNSIYNRHRLFSS